MSIRRCVLELQECPGVSRYERTALADAHDTGQTRSLNVPLSILLWIMTGHNVMLTPFCSHQQGNQKQELADRHYLFRSTVP